MFILPYQTSEFVFFFASPQPKVAFPDHCSTSSVRSPCRLSLIPYSSLFQLCPFSSSSCQLCSLSNHCTMTQGGKLRKSKVFKFKTLLRFQIWSKNIQTFFKWCKTARALFRIFFNQICQKIVDLFKKNMKGWSDKKIILYLFCSSDLLRKKVENNFLCEQPFCVQIFPKYFPNILLII